MRLSFRSALVMLLVAIPLVTVGVVGVVSWFSARYIVTDLSNKVLRQTASRIHDQVVGLLDTAATVSNVNVSVIGNEPIDEARFHELVEHFYAVMLLNDEFTFLSLGLENGTYCHVQRYPDGELEARIYLRESDQKVARRHDYRRRGDEFAEINAVDDEYDPRQRPYYGFAKQAGKQTWPPVYLFMNKPRPDYPGLTCATPIYKAVGGLRGVLTADFDLIALGQFLDSLQIFENGVAFVVELPREEGKQRRVVAHPDPDVIVGDVERDGEVKRDVLPIEQIKSPAIQAFMKEVPDDPGADTTRVSFSVGDEDYVGTYRRLSSEHDVDWLIGIVVPEDDLMAEVNETKNQILIIGIAIAVAAALIGWLIAAFIARPLARLAHETEAIAKFHLDARPDDAPSALREINRLAAAMEEMKAGLRSFQKYVPAELVRSLLESGNEAELGGDRQTLSVYFSDLAGFTSISEKLAPEQLVEILSEYLEAMNEDISDLGGTVDKYIGDAIMAFWGAPKPDAEHARKACETAVRNQRRLAELRARWAARDLPELHMRIGINTGELIVGNMGSAARLNYTVIGDAVNLASRLENLNKFYRTDIIISEATYAAARDHVVARPLERVSVKGKAKGVLVYELLAMKGDATDEQLALVDAATRACDAYLSRDFAAAIPVLEEVLRLRPEDPAAELMIASCRIFLKDPPPANWDGVRRMTTK